MTPQIQKARRILERNLYMSLATTDAGVPWIAPVFYAVDQGLNIYFLSGLDSLHIQHIRRNPHVAAAIFDSTCSPASADSVQMSGWAEPVSADDLPSVLELYYSKRYADVEFRVARIARRLETLNESNLRFYAVMPDHVYTLERSINRIDRRVEVSVSALCATSAD